MALDVTISLGDELHAELVALTNAANVMGGTLTPSQYLRQDVKDRLRQSAAARADRERLRLKARYLQATPEEQAQIDAILAPYAG